jgi:hypothetical protein
LIRLNKFDVARKSVVRMEPTGRREAPPDDRLRECGVASLIASRIGFPIGHSVSLPGPNTIPDYTA